ncbi:MAG: 1-deoxy-D-xylulose-5-phosphate reductoisomerase, partial [Pseudorhodoplanes sp.]
MTTTATTKRGAQARPSGAAGERRVSLLGATGSIGASTIDLLKRDRERYRVEAVTAQKKAPELARLARDLGARVAVVADHSAYGELKDALSGSGIEAASGP